MTQNRSTAGHLNPNEDDGEKLGIDIKDVLNLTFESLQCLFQHRIATYQSKERHFREITEREMNGSTQPAAAAHDTDGGAAIFGVVDSKTFALSCHRPYLARIAAQEARRNGADNVEAAVSLSFAAVTKTNDFLKDFNPSDRNIESVRVNSGDGPASSSLLDDDGGGRSMIGRSFSKGAAMRKVAARPVLLNVSEGGFLTPAGLGGSSSSRRGEGAGHPLLIDPSTIALMVENGFGTNARIDKGLAMLQAIFANTSGGGGGGSGGGVSARARSGAVGGVSEAEFVHFIAPAITLTTDEVINRKLAARLDTSACGTIYWAALSNFFTQWELFNERVRVPQMAFLYSPASAVAGSGGIRHKAPVTAVTLTRKDFPAAMMSVGQGGLGASESSSSSSTTLGIGGGGGIYGGSPNPALNRFCFTGDADGAVIMWDTATMRPTQHIQDAGGVEYRTTTTTDFLGDELAGTNYHTAVRPRGKNWVRDLCFLTSGRLAVAQSTNLITTYTVNPQARAAISRRFRIGKGTNRALVSNLAPYEVLMSSKVAGDCTALCTPSGYYATTRGQHSNSNSNKTNSSEGGNATVSPLAALLSSASSSSLDLLLVGMESGAVELYDVSCIPRSMHLPSSASPRPPSPSRRRRAGEARGGVSTSTTAAVNSSTHTNTLGSGSDGENEYTYRGAIANKSPLITGDSSTYSSGGGAKNHSADVITPLMSYHPPTSEFVGKRAGRAPRVIQIIDDPIQRKIGVLRDCSPHEATRLLFLDYDTFRPLNADAGEYDHRGATASAANEGATVEEWETFGAAPSTAARRKSQQQTPIMRTSRTKGGRAGGLTLPCPIEGTYVNKVHYDPISQLLLGISGSRIACVYSALVGNIVATLADHTSAVVGGALLPDRGLIYTATEDCTVHIYDFRTFRKISMTSLRAPSPAAAAPPLLLDEPFTAFAYDFCRDRPIGVSSFPASLREWHGSSADAADGVGSSSDSGSSAALGALAAPASAGASASSALAMSLGTYEKDKITAEFLSPSNCGKELGTVLTNSAAVSAMIASASATEGRRPSDGLAATAQHLASLGGGDLLMAEGRSVTVRKIADILRCFAMHVVKDSDKERRVQKRRKEAQQQLLILHSDDDDDDDISADDGEKVAVNFSPDNAPPLQLHAAVPLSAAPHKSAPLVGIEEASLLMLESTTRTETVASPVVRRPTPKYVGAAPAAPSAAETVEKSARKAESPQQTSPTPKTNPLSDGGASPPPKTNEATPASKSQSPKEAALQKKDTTPKPQSFGISTILGDLFLTHEQHQRQLEEQEALKEEQRIARAHNPLIIFAGSPFSEVGGRSGGGTIKSLVLDRLGKRIAFVYPLCRVDIVSTVTFTTLGSIDLRPERGEALFGGRGGEEGGGSKEKVNVFARESKEERRRRMRSWNDNNKKTATVSLTTAHKGTHPAATGGRGIGEAEAEAEEVRGDDEISCLEFASTDSGAPIVVIGTLHGHLRVYQHHEGDNVEVFAETFPCAVASIVAVGGGSGGGGAGGRSQQENSVPQPRQHQRLFVGLRFGAMYEYELSFFRRRRLVNFNVLHQAVLRTPPPLAIAPPSPSVLPLKGADEGNNKNNRSSSVTPRLGQRSASRAHTLGEEEVISKDTRSPSQAHDPNTGPPQASSAETEATSQLQFSPFSGNSNGGNGVRSTTEPQSMGTASSSGSSGALFERNGYACGEEAAFIVPTPLVYAKPSASILDEPLPEAALAVAREMAAEQPVSSGDDDGDSDDDDDGTSGSIGKWLGGLSRRAAGGEEGATAGYAHNPKEFRRRRRERRAKERQLLGAYKDHSRQVDGAFSALRRAAYDRIDRSVETLLLLDDHHVAALYGTGLVCVFRLTELETNTVFSFPALQSSRRIPADRSSSGGGNYFADAKRRKIHFEQQQQQQQPTDEADCAQPQSGDDEGNSATTMAFYKHVSIGGDSGKEEHSCILAVGDLRGDVNLFDLSPYFRRVHANRMTGSAVGPTDVATVGGDTGPIPLFYDDPPTAEVVTNSFTEDDKEVAGKKGGKKNKPTILELYQLVTFIGTMTPLPNAYVSDISFSSLAHAGPNVAFSAAPLASPTVATTAKHAAASGAAPLASFSSILGGDAMGPSSTARPAASTSSYTAALFQPKTVAPTPLPTLQGSGGDFAYGGGVAQRGAGGSLSPGGARRGSLAQRLALESAPSSPSRTGAAAGARGRAATTLQQQKQQQQKHNHAPSVEHHHYQMIVSLSEALTVMVFAMPFAIPLYVLAHPSRLRHHEAFVPFTNAAAAVHAYGRSGLVAEIGSVFDACHHLRHIHRFYRETEEDTIVGDLVGLLGPPASRGAADGGNQPLEMSASGAPSVIASPAATLRSAAVTRRSAAAGRAASSAVVEATPITAACGPSSDCSFECPNAKLQIALIAAIGPLKLCSDARERLHPSAPPPAEEEAGVGDAEVVALSPQPMPRRPTTTVGDFMGAIPAKDTSPNNRNTADTFIIGAANVAQPMEDIDAIAAAAAAARIRTKKKKKREKELALHQSLQDDPLMSLSWLKASDQPLEIVLAAIAGTSSEQTSDRATFAVSPSSVTPTTKTAADSLASALLQLLPAATRPSQQSQTANILTFLNPNKIVKREAADGIDLHRREVASGQRHHPFFGPLFAAIRTARRAKSKTQLQGAFSTVSSIVNVTSAFSKVPSHSNLRQQQQQQQQQQQAAAGESTFGAEGASTSRRLSGLNDDTASDSSEGGQTAPLFEGRRDEVRRSPPFAALSPALLSERGQPDMHTSAARASPTAIVPATVPGQKTMRSLSSGTTSTAAELAQSAAPMAAGRPAIPSFTMPLGNTGVIKQAISARGIAAAATDSGVRPSPRPSSARFVFEQAARRIEEQMAWVTDPQDSNDTAVTGSNLPCDVFDRTSGGDVRYKPQGRLPFGHPTALAPPPTLSGRLNDWTSQSAAIYGDGTEPSEAAPQAAGEAAPRGIGWGRQQRPISATAARGRGVSQVIEEESVTNYGVIGIVMAPDGSGVSTPRRIIPSRPASAANFTQHNRQAAVGASSSSSLVKRPTSAIVKNRKLYEQPAMLSGVPNAQPPPAMPNLSGRVPRPPSSATPRPLSASSLGNSRRGSEAPPPPVSGESDGDAGGIKRVPHVPSRPTSSGRQRKSIITFPDEDDGVTDGNSTNARAAADGEPPLGERRQSSTVPSRPEETFERSELASFFIHNNAQSVQKRLKHITASVHTDDNVFVNRRGNGGGHFTTAEAVVERLYPFSNAQSSAPGTAIPKPPPPAKRDVAPKGGFLQHSSSTAAGNAPHERRFVAVAPSPDNQNSGSLSAGGNVAADRVSALIGELKSHATSSSSSGGGDQSSRQQKFPMTLAERIIEDSFRPKPLINYRPVSATTVRSEGSSTLARGVSGEDEATTPTPAPRKTTDEQRGEAQRQRQSAHVSYETTMVFNAIPPQYHAPTRRPVEPEFPHRAWRFTVDDESPLAPFAEAHNCTVTVSPRRQLAISEERHRQKLSRIEAGEAEQNVKSGVVNARMRDGIERDPLAATLGGSGRPFTPRGGAASSSEREEGVLTPNSAGNAFEMRSSASTPLHEQRMRYEEYVRENAAEEARLRVLAEGHQPIIRPQFKKTKTNQIYSRIEPAPIAVDQLVNPLSTSSARKKNTNENVWGVHRAGSASSRGPNATAFDYTTQKKKASPRR